MSTRLGDRQRVRAARAISRDRFCVAIHELQADDPFSIILDYDGSAPQPWGRTDVQRNISGIAVGPNAASYVAVSDEGDIYFLDEGETRTEKLPGAGIYSADADGSGAINGIDCATDGKLYAFGFGGQIYEKTASGAWSRVLLTADGRVAKSGCFLSMASATGSVTYLGGNISAESWRTPAEIEKAQLEAAADGDFARFQELAKEAERWADSEGIARMPRGSLLAQLNGNWKTINIPSEQGINCIYVETAERIWAVGTNGLILFGDAITGFNDISFRGDRTKNLVSITKFQGQMIIASDYGLHKFDGHVLSPIRPKLDPFINRNVPTPLKVQAVDDVLFYFDYKHGVHRWDGADWEEIAIPPELLEREFKGLK